MDDLSERLNEILKDEKSMEKVRNLAESLLSKGEEKNENGFEGEDVSKIISVLSSIRQRGDDKRTALLLALRENLSPEKQQKVDTAVKLLRLIDMLPYLRSSGILDLF